jgi:hypothetical protein
MPGENVGFEKWYDSLDVIEKETYGLSTDDE